MGLDQSVHHNSSPENSSRNHERKKKHSRANQTTTTGLVFHQSQKNQKELRKYVKTRRNQFLLYKPISLSLLVAISMLIIIPKTLQQTDDSSSSTQSTTSSNTTTSTRMFTASVTNETSYLATLVVESMSTAGQFKGTLKIYHKKRRILSSGFKLEFNTKASASATNSRRRDNNQIRSPLKSSKSSPSFQESSTTTSAQLLDYSRTLEGSYEEFNWDGLLGVPSQETDRINSENTIKLIWKGYDYNNLIKEIEKSTKLKFFFLGETFELHNFVEAGPPISLVPFFIGILFAVALFLPILKGERSKTLSSTMMWRLAFNYSLPPLTIFCAVCLRLSIQFYLRFFLHLATLLLPLITIFFSSTKVQYHESWSRRVDTGLKSLLWVLSLLIGGCTVVEPEIGITFLAFFLMLCGFLDSLTSPRAEGYLWGYFLFVFMFYFSVFYGSLMIGLFVKNNQRLGPYDGQLMVAFSVATGLGLLMFILRACYRESLQKCVISLVLKALCCLQTEDDHLNLELERKARMKKSKVKKNKKDKLSSKTTGSTKNELILSSGRDLKERRMSRNPFAAASNYGQFSTTSTPNVAVVVGSPQKSDQNSPYGQGKGGKNGDGAVIKYPRRRRRRRAENLRKFGRESIQPVPMIKFLAEEPPQESTPINNATGRSGGRRNRRQRRQKPSITKNPTNSVIVNENYNNSNNNNNPAEFEEIARRPKRRRPGAVNRGNFIDILDGGDSPGQRAVNIVRAPARNNSLNRRRNRRPQIQNSRTPVVRSRRERMNSGTLNRSRGRGSLNPGDRRNFSKFATFGQYNTDR